MNVTLTLERIAAKSRVLIDGVDISRAVRGVEVQAFAGKTTVVTLMLSPVRVDVRGDVAVNLEGDRDAPELVSYEEAVKLGNAIVDAIVDKDATP